MMRTPSPIKANIVTMYQVGDGPFCCTGSTRFGGVGRRLAAFLRFFETGMGVKANTQKPILSNADPNSRVLSLAPKEEND